MVGIQGIGITPEPANNKQVPGRSQKPAETPLRAEDGIEISPDGTKAAEAARIVAQSPGDFVRNERITQAKENMEQGTHHVQEVVLQVALRLAKFVE